MSREGAFWFAAVTVVVVGAVIGAYDAGRKRGAYEAWVELTKEDKGKAIA